MIIIEHIAIWVNDVEKMKSFYQTYSGAKAGSPYMNKAKQFQSCFLEFGTNARIELMHRPDVADKEQDMQQEHSGYAHIALSVGSEQAVDAVTTRLMSDGYHKLDGPRRTGYGYYESVLLDPENNRIEITV